MVYFSDVYIYTHYWSKKTIMPSSFSSSTYCIMSCIILFASFMFRPFTNPVWSGWISLVKTFFNRLTTIIIIIISSNLPCNSCEITHVALKSNRLLTLWFYDINLSGVGCVCIVPSIWYCMIRIIATQIPYQRLTLHSMWFLSDVSSIDGLVWFYGDYRHFQQYISYIVAVLQ